MNINIEFSEFAKEHLEAMMADTTCKDMKELMNLAYSALDWMIRTRRAGNVIAALDIKSGKYTPLSVPQLDCIKPSN